MTGFRTIHFDVAVAPSRLEISIHDHLPLIVGPPSAQQHLPLHFIAEKHPYPLCLHTAAVMQRVKNITYYDEDDLYSDQEDDYAEEEYSQEDLDNFANLTPVVKSELQEAGLQASDREAQDALWDAYWDVAAAVADLRARKVKAGSEKRAAEAKKAQEKPKSRFDQAAERNASTGGESYQFISALTLA